MDKLPLVSYIVPCFNQGHFLHECVASIQASYSGPKEILVINDCSTNPSTRRKIEAVQQTFPEIRVIHNEENLGLAATRNRGLDLASGDFIQFLDADDLLFPRKVDHQVRHLRSGNRLDISLSDYIFCDETLSEFYLPDIDFGAYELSLDDFLYRWERGLSIPIHSGLFRKEVFTSTRFEGSLTAKEDWVFWCTQAIQHRRMAYLNFCGAAYRQHLHAMTKKRVDEMGRMWLKAALHIDDLLEHDARFIGESLLWYQVHYEDTDLPLAAEPAPARQELPVSASELKVSQPVVKSGIKFTVLVPVYNHYEYLYKCFQSVLDQTFANIEILCIDDNSTDGRVRLFLDELAEKFPNVRVLHNGTNAGIVASFNKGIGAAQGEFIAFLDCDDYLPANALEVVARALEEQPEIDYFFSDKIDVDENDRSLRTAVYGGYPHIHPSGDIENDLLDGMVASHLKVIRKVRIFEAGGFEPALDGVQDFDLALKMIRTSRFQYIDRPLYYHRQHTHSVTQADTISQFRKENIARRNFCVRWYPPRPGGKDPPVIYTPDHYSLPDIKGRMKERLTCIFDARGARIGKWAYFLREYNSFFEQILTDDPQMAMFLLGYLWDPEIIRLDPPACPQGVITVGQAVEAQ